MALIQEPSRSGLLRTKGTPSTQKIARFAEALCQEQMLELKMLLAFLSPKKLHGFQEPCVGNSGQRLAHRHSQH